MTYSFPLFSFLGQQYSKKCLPFAFPSPTLRPQIMLPPKDICWLAKQPEHILSLNRIRRQRLSFDYLLPSVRDPLSDPTLIGVIRTDLTRRIASLHPSTAQQMRKAVDLELGRVDEGWHDVCLFSAVRNIVTTVTAGIVYTQPLCENADFMRSLRGFHNVISVGVALSGSMTPWPLRPVVGLICAGPIYWYMRATLKHLVTVVQKRFDVHQGEKQGKPSVRKPDDFVSRYVQAAVNATPNEWTARNATEMAQRLLLIVSHCHDPRSFEMRERLPTDENGRLWLQTAQSLERSQKSCWIS